MEQPKLDKPLPRYKPNPLVANLPAHLKDPANFEKIKRVIAESMQGCKKTHEGIGEMATCPTCSEKMKERRLVLKRLGFQNPAQLRKWYEIHNTIQNQFVKTKII